MRETNIEIVGVAPLIVHNGRLADPLDPITRQLAELTGKRKKTLEDHHRISRVEWEGGLYLDEDDEPCLPSECIEATLVAGAKRTKQGRDAKAGIVVPDHAKLVYDGPKDVEAMWASGKFLKRNGVRVGPARVIRSRPIFHAWSAVVRIVWDPDVIRDEPDLMKIAEAAGQMGTCEWRPRFGRFEVHKLEAGSKVKKVK